MRAALGKLLLSGPDLLLLDEPTNHLDLESVIWLEAFLSGYAGAILLISHDRNFMNRVVHRVVLDLAGDHPHPARIRGAAGPVDALDRQVVAFRAAPGEDHLGRLGSQRRRDPLPRLLDQAPGPTTRRMQRRRVSKLTRRGETYEAQRRERNRDFAIAAVATAYTAFLLFAAGWDLLLLSTILYALGTILYVWARREQGKAVFPRTADWVLFGIAAAGCITGIYLLTTGAMEI